MDLQYTKCSPLYNNNTWSSLWTNKVENDPLGTYLKLLQWWHVTFHSSVLSDHKQEMPSSQASSLQLFPLRGHLVMSDIFLTVILGLLYLVGGGQAHCTVSCITQSTPSPTPSLEELSSPRCQQCWRLNCSLNSEWGLTSNVRLFRFLWWDILILIL